MGKLITQVDVPVGQSGNWKIVRQTISADESAVSAINSKGRYVRAGTYTFLYRGDTLVMSDTSDEMRDHIGAVHAATGQVLIVGLGIGMVVQACLEKKESQGNYAVDKVTVIEKSEDVIRLAGGHYRKKYGNRIEIIQADIFEWKLPKGARWTAIWFDVWDTLCSDNLKEMTKLKRRFARRAAWKGCWGESWCRRDKKRWDSQLAVWRG